MGKKYYLANVYFISNEFVDISIFQFEWSENQQDEN